MSVFQPKILYFDSLPSTNTEAARHAQQGAPEGVIIISREQTAGRGRLQRQWASPAGAGLYFSIILRPRQELALWSLLPLLGALAVHDALRESCALETDIKWPNDILFGERKLCGILAETIETTTGRAVIIGIGINLRSDAFPEDLRDVATSIADATGAAGAQETVLQSLVQALANRYEMFQTDDGAARIVRDWSHHSSYANGKNVLVTSIGETFRGITRGLESDGALRVETEAGEIRTVRAGDVTSVRTSS
ncbi:MAG: biotin--[acetyl-CoA-carboxylase] ligase [Acidobacteriota bacterium]|nr:biotin--[acetyl-CoA-carboxylase] ligase [Acidobacteriota bacterium]